MNTIGFIYPDHAAEDDYPLAQRMLGGGIDLAVEHIYGTDLHAVPELRDLGSPERLAEGARKLAKHSPDAVVWACTSGSFVFGNEGAAEQAAKLAQASDTPASSTSFAFARAAQALGVHRVAIAASYPDEIAELFVRFLALEDIDVIHVASASIDTAAEVGRLTDAGVLELIAGADHPDADAVLIPDTAMRTIGLLGSLEARLAKPVLTANQVTIWEGLRIAGAMVPASSLGADLGTLFATKPTGPQRP